MIRIESGTTTSQGTEVDVHERSWNHADKAEDVVFEGNSSNSKGVVQQIERKYGGESGQDNNFQTFFANGFVNRPKFFITCDLLGDPVTSQITSYQEGGSGSQRRTNKNVERTPKYAKDCASTQGND